MEYRYILYPRQEYFPRPEAEVNILYICRYSTRKGFEYLVYYIGYSLRGTTVSVATYPLTMRSIRGGTLGWNIEIYSTPTNQFDWSVSRAYVINIYICLWTKKKFESYFRDRFTFSNIRSRTSRQIYRLALPLCAPEMLSSLSKSRISIFNAHLTLFFHRMMSLGKYRHLVN